MLKVIKAELNPRTKRNGADGEPTLQQHKPTAGLRLRTFRNPHGYGGGESSHSYAGDDATSYELAKAEGGSLDNDTDEGDDASQKDSAATAEDVARESTLEGTDCAAYFVEGYGCP